MFQFFKRVLFLLLLTQIYSPAFAARAAKKSPPVQTTQVKQAAKEEEGEGIRKTWVWAGASALFLFNDLKYDVNHPIVSYQVGLATSLKRYKNDKLLYLAYIFDGAHSDRNGMEYYFANASAVIGYEYPIGRGDVFTKQFMSLFAELGPSFGFRELNYKRANCQVCSSGGYTFNGLLNLGFNLNFNPNSDVNYLIRVAAQGLIGTHLSGYIDHCRETANINPITLYAPTLAFAVRW